MNDKNLKIILVEDNVMLRENTLAFLELKNLSITAFEDIEEFEKKIDVLEFDVIVLDINLPGKSGLEYTSELRAKGKDYPIILLTSQNTSEDIVAGLENGADDYISKPFNFDELVARIRNAARKKSNHGSNKVLLSTELGEVNIDLAYKKVMLEKHNIYLPNLEYELLAYLLVKRGKIIPRDELYEEVWGEFDKYQLSRTVDVYIGYLRKKLGKDVIKTRKGDGYYIE